MLNLLFIPICHEQLHISITTLPALFMKESPNYARENVIESWITRIHATKGAHDDHWNDIAFRTQCH